MKLAGLYLIFSLIIIFINGLFVKSSYYLALNHLLINWGVKLINFISIHRVVVIYYYVNILIFLVGLTGVLWYNDMTAADFVNDFKEFRVLFYYLKNKILPEIFPEWFEELEVDE